MTRSWAALTISCLLALAVAGCTNGARNHRDALTPSASPAGTFADPGRPQAANLRLSAGRSSSQYQITAPSPAQYGFTVTATAPASAEISISISTWYGAMLPSILDSTHDPAWCRKRGSQDACFELFPLLPAQRAGSWTVVASKRSEAAAVVHVAIMFAKP